MYKIVQLLLVLGVVSCSSQIQKMAVSTSGEVFHNAAKEMETELNWDYFRDSAVAGMRIVEGLNYLDEKNPTNLATLVKGHVALAYSLFETNALFATSFSQKENELFRAKYHYSKAIRYGFLYLESKNIQSSELLKSMRGDGVKKFLDKQLSKHLVDVETVLYFAQALGAMINLHKDKMNYLALAPLMNEMFQWSCGILPEINFGACSIFSGAYEASRPKMLGGDPEKGKAIFLKAIKDNPENYLIRVAFIEYYLMPLKNKKMYLEQKSFLMKKMEEFNNNQIWSPSEIGKVKEESNRHLQFFQALALQRFKAIMLNDNNLF